MNQYTGIYRRCELWFIRRELEQFGLQPLEGKIIMFLQDNQCTQEDIGAHFDLEIRFWKKYTAYQAGGTRFALRDSQRKSAGSSRIICGGLLKMQLNINTE